MDLYPKIISKEKYELAYLLIKQNPELLEKYKYAIEAFPEVTNVLEKLHNKYDIILISNAKREFIEIELEVSKLKKFFSLIFSSTTDFNMVKKVSDFYLMICNKMGVNPKQIIHVGDHKEFDYNIPKKLGIKSFYLNRERTDKGKFIVHDLKEFLSRVENSY